MHIQPNKGLSAIDSLINKAGVQQLAKLLLSSETAKFFKGDVEKISRFIATEFGISINIDGRPFDQEHRTALRTFSIKLGSQINEVAPFDADAFYNQVVDVFQARTNLTIAYPNIHNDLKVITDYYTVITNETPADYAAYLKQVRATILSATAVRNTFDFYHLINY